MQFDDIWAELQDRCASLDEGAVLEMPATQRVLRVEDVHDEGIEVRSPKTAESRTLQRGRFESLAEELATGEMDVDSLPPGAEAYAAVLTLHPDFSATDDALAYEVNGNSDAESVLLEQSWEERTAPVRLRDDTTILADLLDRFEEGSPSIESLVDLYVLLSDVQYEAGDLREEIRDDLLERMETDEQLHGRFGAVTKTERKRRRLKDESTILHTLDDRGIPRGWVLSVDRQQLDVIIAVTDLEEEDVYDVETNSYVQKTDVDRLEKDAHVRGLAAQLPHLESDRAERLHDELEDIEERIDSLLAS